MYTQYKRSSKLVNRYPYDYLSATLLASFHRTYANIHVSDCFVSSLPQSSPTTDDIEVRICGDSRIGDEDTPIQLIELYIKWTEHSQQLQTNWNWNL